MAAGRLPWALRRGSIPLFAAVALALPSELNSESVTLNTYYPAPSGVYTQMIATSNGWLARDGGSLIVGGMSNPSGDKLAVNGTTRLGGATSVGGPLSVGGLLSVLDGARIGAGYAGSAPPSNGLIVQGTVGVRTNSPDPAFALHAEGKALVRNYLFLGGAGTSCLQIGPTANTGCPSSHYATWISGVYNEGYSYQSTPTVYTTPGIQAYMGNAVYFLCCIR